jgi:hypothetical protein
VKGRCQERRPFSFFSPMDKTQEMVVQAQALLATPTATLQELNVVYQILTGTVCRTSRKIRYMLNSFVTNPSRYQLRIQQYFDNQTMANEQKKYRFSPKATSTLIIVHDKNGSTVKVTPETLTDARAELVLSYPSFAHNIERIPEKPVKAAPVAKAEVAPVAEEAAPAPAPKKRRSKKKNNI